MYFLTFPDTNDAVYFTTKEALIEEAQKWISEGWVGDEVYQIYEGSRIGSISTKTILQVDI